MILCKLKCHENMKLVKGNVFSFCDINEFFLNINYKKYPQYTEPLCCWLSRTLHSISMYSTSNMHEGKEKTKLRINSIKKLRI